MSLQLRDLKRIFVAPDGTAVPVIDIPHFQVDRGAHVCLRGTSGTGKTTLLHLIAGILRPDSGNIIFQLPDDTQIDITTLAEAQRDVFRGRHLGYIFQTHHLLNAFTALENVLLGMSFTGRRQDRPWAVHLLEEVGLADRLNFRPEKLSLGQQQRVAVARALANRPAVVLADEPTGSLDVTHAQQVIDLIRRLCTEVSATLILVTHDPQIAQQMPRIVQLSELSSPALANNASVSSSA